MESDDVREQLLEVQRGESAAWTDPEPGPRWYPAFFTAWTAVLALNMTLGEGLGSPWVYIGLTFVAIGVDTWVRRRRGIAPRGLAPYALWPVIAAFAGGVLGLFVVAVLVGLFVGSWWGVALAVVGAYALMHWYVRAYDDAAAAARRTLGGTR